MKRSSTRPCIDHRPRASQTNPTPGIAPGNRNPHPTAEIAGHHPQREHRSDSTHDCASPTTPPAMKATTTASVRGDTPCASWSRKIRATATPRGQPSTVTHHHLRARARNGRRTTDCAAPNKTLATTAAAQARHTGGDAGAALLSADRGRCPGTTRDWWPTPNATRKATPRQAAVPCRPSTLGPRR